MKQKPISESDYITNKILLVFSFALLGTLALMMVQKFLADPQTAIVTIYVLQVLTALFGVGIVYGVYRSKRENRNSVDTARKLITGRNVILFFSILLFCCVFIMTSDSTAAIRTLYIVIPGSAILYLIKAIYIREFFIISLVCTFGALLLWGASRILASGHVFLFPFCIALGVLSALALGIALFKAKKADGVLNIGSFSFPLMDKRSEYSTSYFTLAIVVIMMIASLFVKVQLITYFSFALLSYLFIMAVYYTVKLM